MILKKLNRKTIALVVLLFLFLLAFSACETEYIFRDPPEELQTASSSSSVKGSCSSNVLASSSGSDVYWNTSIEYGELFDEREGKIYRTVEIGSQTWMAENLNYETSSGSRCYDDDPDSCDTYGRLYDWAAVMGLNDSCLTKNCLDQIQEKHQGICPAGFHVPTSAEWTTLTDYVGGSSIAGTKLKSAIGWNIDYGTDDYGFSALPGGLYYSGDGSFDGARHKGNWWSASESSASDAFRWYMHYRDTDLVSYYGGKVGGFSLRCVRDEAVLVSSSSVPLSSSSTGNTDPGVFTCAPQSSPINKGGEAAWTSSFTGTGVLTANYSWTFEGGTPSVKDGDYTVARKPSVIYVNSGSFGASLSINGGDPVTCSPLQVNGDPITGSCTASPSPVGIAGASATITYTMNALSNSTIIGYSWTKASGTSNIATFTATEKGTVEGVCVEVSNDDNTKQVFNCPEVKVADFVTDTRDGQIYEYVTIGNQIWMAENLNYTTSSGFWCYDNDPSNCDTYGRLYDWATVMGFSSSCNTSSCANQIETPHRGICPSGWHVPSNAEWTTLINYVGSNAGTKLKSATGWNNNGNGTDDYGFSALSGGLYYSGDGSFDDARYLGNWWSASESSASDAYNRLMYYDYTGVHSDYRDKDVGFSLRCLKD